MALNWLTGLFTKKEISAQDAICSKHSEECASAAFDAAYIAVVSLVARMIAGREFRTFKAHKEHRGREWYRWNYHVSANLSPAAFWYAVVDSMFSKGEALILDIDGELLPADAWTAGDEVLYDRTYSQIVAGGMEVIKTFKEKDVIHLYSNFGWRPTGIGTPGNLEALKKSYIRLVKAAISGYTKSKGIKGTLEMDTTLAGTQAFQDNLQKMRDGEFGKFAEADNAILPLYKGMKYNALSEKTYSGETTRDVRSLIDDALDFVARAYGIPPQLVNGSNTDVEPALEYALTSFFDPLFNQISNEITRKCYGQKAVFRGDYLRIDARQIKHTDIIDEASHLSSLIGTGLVSVNEVLHMLGDTIIDEDWADGHFITLNNAPAGTVVTPAKGGE